jgi:hypothetical protein
MYYRITDAFRCLIGYCVCQCKGGLFRQASNDTWNAASTDAAAVDGARGCMLQVNGTSLACMEQCRLM